MGKYIDFGAKKKKDEIINMGARINADLEGKINNVKDFKSEALTPLFEAIVNSIQAIKERQNPEKGEITINIIREPYTQKELPNQNQKKDETRKPSIIKNFEIVDNGIGFNDPNFDSFAVSDSIYKKSRGGKGIGRFSWLKAFDKIEIESVYSENGTKKKRSVGVTVKNWIQPPDGNVKPVSDITQQQTIVRLIGFKKKYRTAPTAYKTTDKIAQRILEHFLPYYIQKSAPSIKVKDGSVTIPLDQLYRIIGTDDETITVGEEQFTIHHVKLYDTHKDVHKIVFCANDLDVKIYRNIIKQIIGTASLHDGDKQSFYYAAYVSGNFFDERVDTGRTSFDIPDETDDQEWYGEVVSLNKIRDEVIEHAKNYLSEYIKEIQIQKQNMFSNFAVNNPETRHVIKYCPNIVDEIGIDASDEEINKVLFKNKGIAEWELRKSTKDLLKKKHVQNIQEIEEGCKKLSEQITDFQKDDLAQYLLKRKFIIELFQKKLELNRADGKYELESEIHDILFPRYTSSDEQRFEDHNLWMIDENLVYHHFAYSNEPIGETVPDIIIFRDVDDNSIAKSVSIIEIKRPQQPTLKEKSIVQQMFDVISELRIKKIKCKGRDINVNPSTKYNCFAICDINEQIVSDAVGHNLTQFKDDLGYYGFNSWYNAYIEVLAYDQILSDVKKRHNAFFDKLGIKGKIN